MQVPGSVQGTADALMRAAAPAEAEAAAAAAAAESAEGAEADSSDAGSSAAEPRQQEEDKPAEPSCSICYEAYGGAVVPRMLVACGHTFCEGCLSQVCHHDVVVK